MESVVTEFSYLKSFQFFQVPSVVNQAITYSVSWIYITIIMWILEFYLQCQIWIGLVCRDNAYDFARLPVPKKPRTLESLVWVVNFVVSYIDPSFVFLINSELESLDNRNDANEPVLFSYTNYLATHTLFYIFTNMEIKLFIL